MAATRGRAASPTTSARSENSSEIDGSISSEVVACSTAWSPPRTPTPRPQDSARCVDIDTYSAGATESEIPQMCIPRFNAQRWRLKLPPTRPEDLLVLEYLPQATRRNGRLDVGARRDASACRACCCCCCNEGSNSDAPSHVASHQQSEAALAARARQSNDSLPAATPLPVAKPAVSMPSPHAQMERAGAAAPRSATSKSSRLRASIVAIHTDAPVIGVIGKGDVGKGVEIRGEVLRIGGRRRPAVWGNARKRDLSGIITAVQTGAKGWVFVGEACKFQNPCMPQEAAHEQRAVTNLRERILARGF